MNRIDLADGTHLAERAGGLFTWFPEERTVAVTVAGGVATLATADSPAEIVAEIPVATSGRGKAPWKPGGGRKASGLSVGGPSGESGRWATLNAFEDLVANHLSPTEQAVWHYLFRWCRDGTASASVRDLASTRGLDSKTAAKALSSLIAVGLVWYVFKASHKGKRSVFAMHLHPAQCREACEVAEAPRRAKQKRRCPPPVRDRESRMKPPRKPR